MNYEDAVACFEQVVEEMRGSVGDLLTQAQVTHGGAGIEYAVEDVGIGEPIDDRHIHLFPSEQRPRANAVRSR